MTPSSVCFGIVVLLNWNSNILLRSLSTSKGVITGLGFCISTFRRLSNRKASQCSLRLAIICREFERFLSIAFLIGWYTFVVKNSVSVDSFGPVKKICQTYYVTKLKNTRQERTLMKLRSMISCSTWSLSTKLRWYLAALSSASPPMPSFAFARP